MNRLKKLPLIILMVIMSFTSYAQQQSYEVSLTPVTVDGLGGLQSYSIGVHNGEWLIIGGRLDGLHQRQPFASFSADGKNQEIIVVNPEENKVWKSSLSSLPVGIREQFSSSNMQFYQDGDILLCTGGYGYSPSVDDHITYPYLTVVNIPQTINAIKAGSLTAAPFKLIEHEEFRLSGGRLNKISDEYYLVGGHNFMGRYNPMGPENGPGFEQTYSDEIRKFKLDKTDKYALEIIPAIHDEMHLHRRDYNLVPYMAQDERRLMMYSGVFQNTADIPWLYPVSISNDTYEPIEDFTQYFNHYHCATLPIYDSSIDEMHTLFFGGIAQFYEEDNILVQDNDVPFVNTIADISRTASGALVETKLSAEMPGLLGAGSEFILDPSSDLVDEDIIDGSQINDEFTDVGYIFGGIRSTLPNIFWINTGLESEASKTIYKVSIRKKTNTTSSSHTKPRQTLQFYPNPVSKIVRMAIDLKEPQDLTVQISNIQGQKIHSQLIKKQNLTSGMNYILLDEVNIGYGAFLYTVSIGDKLETRKVIWSE